jgi:transcriptional regulator with XRE-family HTH domain
MGQRTAQLLEILRLWCRKERGRQTQVARVLGIRPSTVADWMSGRRQFTGEQSMAVNEFLRTVYANPDALARQPGSKDSRTDDHLHELHAGLEHQGKKNVWVRTVGDYHHVILGGPARDAALDRLMELLRKA